MRLARKQLLPVFPERRWPSVHPCPRIWPFRGPGNWVEYLARLEGHARLCPEVLLDDGRLRDPGKEQTHGHESLYDVMRDVPVRPGTHDFWVVFVVVKLQTEPV